MLTQQCAVHSSATFILSFPSTTVHEFSEKCEEFYKHDQTASSPRRLLIFAGLYWLAAEFSALDCGHSSKYHAALSKRFHNLVLRTLTNFPLLLPASTESVEALMAGVCRIDFIQCETQSADRICCSLVSPSTSVNLHYLKHLPQLPLDYARFWDIIASLQCLLTASVIERGRRCCSGSCI